MRFTVCMFDRGEWHAISASDTWERALAIHQGAIMALRVVDHPHSEEPKIIPGDATYEHAPLWHDPEDLAYAKEEIVQHGI